MLARGVKRAMDVVLGSMALLIASPVMLVTAIIVRFTMGSPVLFCQSRPGRGEVPFMMYKFRTMTSECDSAGNLLPDDQRLTGFGKLMRKTSLDELPQFFNVVKGDMSLVGPRPLLVRYLSLYTPDQRRRHLMKPGITGWAQINGRHDIPLTKRIALDVWYVDHWGLWLDVKILALTLPRVFFSKGVKLTESAAHMMDIGPDLHGTPASPGVSENTEQPVAPSPAAEANAESIGTAQSP